ncbi:unnamed protein product [marine sediment metagenome]|uniref:Uncharacterized protein n=1 Tax=marine sediment metagenome TaxID=412755 RepID=X0TWM3_9ZZZZ
MHHYNSRKNAGLPFANLPEFRFSAIASHKKKLLWGETIVDGNFSCDGETVHYVTPKQNYEFPVTAVRDVQIKELRSKHGRTKYEVILTLDPSYGPAELKINILQMSNNEEVDRYCRALPSVFTESKLDGYWS